MIALWQSALAKWQMDWAYPGQNGETGGAHVQASCHPIHHNELVVI
jgi:hypothetical protein